MINEPPKHELEEFFYDRETNESVAMAFDLLRQLTDWFWKYNPEGTSLPNIRVGRSVLAVLIGEHCVWNSEENDSSQLNMKWVLNEYEKSLMDEIKPIDDWKADE